MRTLAPRPPTGRRAERAGAAAFPRAGEGALFPLGILSVLEGWVSQRVNLEGGAGLQGRLSGRAPGWEASGDGARGSGSLSPTPTPAEGEVSASFGSRTFRSSHPVREAPEPSVLLQVTMADRAAAERACKDPNPNIDGRKANVNLAYLGAKPRSLQTGERACVFLPRLALIAIFSVGICGVETAPLRGPAPGVAVCYHVLAEPSRGRPPPAWELDTLV